MAYRYEPVQLHIMWSWRDGLQSDTADCGLSCTESCPRRGDSCSECGPQFPLIAGPTHLDCRPLHLAAWVWDSCRGIVPFFGVDPPCYGRQLSDIQTFFGRLHPKDVRMSDQLSFLYTRPCRAPHGWFILRVLMLHSNQIVAEAPWLGREHG
jgi:hypothetical protein